MTNEEMVLTHLRQVFPAAHGHFLEPNVIVLVRDPKRKTGLWLRPWEVTDQVNALVEINLDTGDLKRRRGW